MEPISKSSIEYRLRNADLFVDKIYKGNRFGHAGDEVLPLLLGVDNTGGFRYLGVPRTCMKNLRILALLTGFNSSEWPDSFDPESGILTYYGDKRDPGDIHDTGRQGNLTLRNMFDSLHSTSPRNNFPVVLVFAKAKPNRDVQFLGLAVPGADEMSSDEDLVAVWRQSKDGKRFQNYKATFTILDCPMVSRNWLNDIGNGNAFTSAHVPKVWKDWVSKGKYNPLRVERPTKFRSKSDQAELLPKEREVISLIHSTYKGSEHDFEGVAAKLVRLAIPNCHSIELTRPWRDGGRDALGKYRIGTEVGGIDVDFAIEAKCKKLNRGVGVEATSRLLSRLRHRQFGVMVTTSFLSSQAYQEIIEDDHPVIVISAKDICKLLLRKFSSLPEIKNWLNS